MNLRKNLIGKLCLLAMLGSMQPQLDAAKPKKDEKHKNAKHKSSSRSSSSSSDSNCCKKTLHGLKDIEKKLGCDDAHVISSVPAVIDKPGKWCIKKDLVYKGSTPAINITASNVTLNFNNHSLRLTNPSAVGVYADGVKEITILNDIIQSSSVSTNPSSSAFYFVDCEKVTLDNIFTANTFFGVHVVNCKDVFVSHSRFKDHIGGGGTIYDLSGGLRADGCTAVVVEESTFSGAGNGLYQGNGSNQAIFRDGSTACRISHCEFAGVEGAVLGFGVDGLVIEDCVSQTAARPASTEVFFTPLIQLGSSAEGAGIGIQASNVTVKNCLLNGNVVIDYTECRPDFLHPETLSCNPVEGNFQIPIYIGQASKVLIDNCEIGNFITAVFGSVELRNGMIHIYVDEDQVRPHDIAIRGCTIYGNIEFIGDAIPYAQGFAIVFVRTDDIVIEDCSFIGMSIFVISPNAYSSNIVIRDSTVDGSGHCAIIFGTGVEGVLIANNKIMNTGTNSMQIIDQGGNVIKNVVIEGNFISSGKASGVYLGNTENVIIRDNIIDNTAQNGFTIGVADPEDIGPCVNTTIQGNTVSSSGNNGAQIAFCTDTTLQDNVFTYNGQDESEGIWNGILVDTCANTEVTGNTCSGNAGVGIIIANATGTYVQNNTTTHNGLAGIVDVDNVGQVTAFFNKSCDNGGPNCDGISLTQAPGDTSYLFGSNLCCSDPDVKAGAKKAKAATKNKSNALPEPGKAPTQIDNADDSNIARF